MVREADEHARELAADRVLHIFQRLVSSSFWGPRTDDILRAALLDACKCAGAEWAGVHDLRGTGTADASGAATVRHEPAGLPEVLKTYWAGFDALCEAEQLQAHRAGYQ